MTRLLLILLKCLRRVHKPLTSTSLTVTTKPSRDIHQVPSPPGIGLPGVLDIVSVPHSQIGRSALQYSLNTDTHWRVVEVGHTRSLAALRTEYIDPVTRLITQVPDTGRTDGYHPVLQKVERFVYRPDRRLQPITFIQDSWAHLDTP
jgi:hypothetical protein